MTAATKPALPLTLADARGLIRKKSVKSLSFSLYGTLLLRRAIGPEAVFERTLAYADLPGRYRDIPDSFVQHRNLAGNRSKFERWQGRGQSGFGIQDVYGQMAVNGMGLAPEHRAELARAEFRAESELALFNPLLKDLWDEARRQGKRVGILSDSPWSADQIRALLAAAAPDLAPDFIYSSADPESRVGRGLFRRYLETEGLKPGQALHVGQEDESHAPPSAGVTVVPYALPEDPWAALYEREESVARLLQMSDNGFRWRFDNGFRLLRGVTLAAMQPGHVKSLVAAAVLGPAMLGFHHHVDQLMAGLRGPGRNIKLMYLARDAYLSHRVWNDLSDDQAYYIEINRRIAMIAGSEGDEGYKTLRSLFEGMTHVTPPSIEQFFKIKLSAKAKAFFKEHDGCCTGKEFADAMTGLLGGRAKLMKMAVTLRDAMLEYLVAKLGPLEDITDFVMVDIGYTGNIQRALRRVFDKLGLKIRLHGVYLLPHGEAFINMAEGDSVSGYFDDQTLTPAVKRAVMRDGPLVEEFCCAPVGSTRGYDKGVEVRETDVRLPQEIAFCMEMQEEVLRFIATFRKLSAAFGIDVTQDLQRFRSWTAAALARFVILPTGLECQTFGPLLHDVSLGSKGLIATITTRDIENLMGALPFPAVASISHPPVWLGGSLTAHTGVAGFAYAMCGLGLSNNDVLGDVAVGQVEAMILKGEQGTNVPVSVMLTPFGDLRLRVPVLAKDSGGMVAIPLVAQIQRGVIRSLILQGGLDVATATASREGEPLPLLGVKAIRAVLDGSYFRATEPEAYLLIDVPETEIPVLLLNVQVTPLFH
ncbi:MAG TPA: hypothetical protein VM661_15415 [Candidatus Sulfotelmatobacter sp.]|nr:hypothetical protein [Candidatus Sulfotelmatobacter sp.]